MLLYNNNVGGCVTVVYNNKSARVPTFTSAAVVVVGYIHY